MTTPIRHHDQRALAVREAIEAVRAIEAGHGVTREALDRIKPELVKLASRTDLFPPESFGNLPGRPGTIFHLAEDADGGFALYGSAGAPGKAQPPHNHTTWACISGVFGEEHNVAYERTDDRIRVRALHPASDVMAGFYRHDRARFAKALATIGAVPTEPADEPINALVTRYENELDLKLAAAELGLDHVRADLHPSVLQRMPAGGPGERDPPPGEDLRRELAAPLGQELRPGAGVRVGVGRG